MTDIDFGMLGIDPEAAAAPEAQEAVTPEPLKGNAAIRAISAGAKGPTTAKESNDAALAGIADIFGLTTDETEEPETDDEKPAKEDKKESAQPAAAKELHIHDARLLTIAGTWGITPDQAALYPTDESLIGEIHRREEDMGRQRQLDAAKEAAKAKKAESELKLPEIKVDEIEDPAAKAAVSAMHKYMADMKARHDAEVEALRKDNDELKSEYEQAADRQARDHKAKIARLFDDTVASWDDDLKERLGVPTESFQPGKSGTSQHAETHRLHKYVARQRLGYIGMTGEEPPLETMKEFLEEARGALWRDHAQKVATRQVSDRLKKQRGAVAMRPTQTRATEKPEQGDGAALNAIIDFASGNGFNPWQKGKRTA